MNSLYSGTTAPVKMVTAGHCDFSIGKDSVDILTNRKVEQYLLARTSRGYNFMKLADGSTYSVQVSDDRTKVSCTCKGYFYGGKCKHCEVVKHLIKQS